jgi:hypothetical protein
MITHIPKIDYKILCDMHHLKNKLELNKLA